MDLTSIFLFCLISLVIGAVLMILVQYYVFVKYFNTGTDDQSGPEPRNKSINEKYQLPDAILGGIHAPELANRNPTIAFNLIFQFLFFELRNANKVRKWFHRKLSLELDELISKTTTGRLFDKLSIRDLDLGAQFPEIKDIKVLNAEMHDTEGHLENIELMLDVQYQGNFHMSIDADMVLGKKGFLSIKVRNIAGLVRLQFTRIPYTHWALCFMGDPVIDFEIETQFQGRQIQSNVTSLISNQIRKAIRRKHTFPNYTLCYKPFFHKTIEDDMDLSEVQLDGMLDINVAELTRLKYPTHISSVFCTLTMAPIAWVTARQHDDRTIICALDIEIHKAKNQQIGIVFKQLEHDVLVDAVIPNTPAMKAHLCKGDLLVSIEGKKIQNINNITKILKSLNRPVFKLRIERIVGGVIRNDIDTMTFDDDDMEDSYEVINDMNHISFSKMADTVQIGAGKSVRQSSSEKMSTDSSRSNTPTNSPYKNRENCVVRNRSKSLSRQTSDAAAKPPPTNEETALNKIAQTQKAVAEADVGNGQSDEFEYPMHTTIDCSVNSFVTLNDLCQFKIDPTSMYMNLNVFGRSNDDTVLLGYLNIPVQNVLFESNDSTLAHFVKQFPLTPPDAPNLSTHQLSSQSGFDPNQCFGDVLLSFSWNGSGANTISSMAGDTDRKTKPVRLSSSTERLDAVDKSEMNVSRQHDFERKHFQRTTQCDFCGRKIWLKDGVQCRECSMCCHRKCTTKCQGSTICGPVDATAAIQQSSGVEFKVTDTDADGEIDDFGETEEPRPHKSDQHRQSFSDLISQGIKRVNSANNLAIPAIVSSLNQGSRSLPPSPQHTPRKQSLVNTSTNPFVVVTQKLEQLPDRIDDITREQIVLLTEPLIGWGTPDQMMALANTASRNLFCECEPDERVELINKLLFKLRLALDSETTAHANLAATPAESTRIPLSSNNNSSPIGNNVTSSTIETTPTKKIKENQHDLARKAFLIGQSEERVQALSVIMLHLCTGLQYAQGVASQ